MSQYPGYNPPGNFQPNGFHPPPPGPSGPSGPPPPPGAGAGFPGQQFAPPPPQMMQPGIGFSSPPPPGSGPPPARPAGMLNPPAPMGGPPPPPGGAGTVPNLNAAMGQMNLNNNAPPPPNFSTFQPTQPTAPTPNPPLNSAMSEPNSQFYPPAGAPAPYGQPGGAVGAAGPAQIGGVFEDNVDLSIKIPKSMFRFTAKMPFSSSMAATCKVPIGGVIRPYALPAEGEDDIDIVHPGAAGIIRCKRCRTYVNAFVSWLENGRRWRCNICNQINDCPSAYFCHLDEKNRRRDAAQRPELSKSVIEWVAPSEYMVRPPQPPAYFFVLDVSMSAVSTGMLTAASNAIKKSLDDLPGGERTMVGFITYDTSVHYYSLKPGSSNAQMMVVGDLKELFVPAPDDLLVSLKDSREAVDNLLENLPTMFARNTCNSSCLGPALKAAFTVTKSVGGKMCVFQTLMPSLGDGVLKPRENARAMGTPDEVKMLKPNSTWYKDTAVEFSRSQISVDLYLFPNQYIDCATLQDLPKVTAGKMFTYVAFDLERDGPKFESQLNRRLIQSTAFEAVLRIRCTKGMRISNFYGNFFIRGTDLLALPNCSTDSVFGFDLVHDDQNCPNSIVTVQSALLYTTSDGERRIRVSTEALPVTQRASELMASIDQEAVCALLSKQAIDISIKTNLDNARNRLQQSCVDMIRIAKEGDKRTVSGYTVPQQGAAEGDKTIPDNLKLLPLYTLALLKNVAFRGGTDVHPDERIASHMKLSSMFVDECLSFIHPRLFAIHSMDPSVGLPSSDDNDENVAGRNKILLPEAINLSIERLNSDGVFMLSNNEDIYVWVGRAADPSVLTSLFGVDSLENADMSKITMNTSGNDLASRVESIIQSLHENYGGLPSIAPKKIIVREGDAALESRLFWNLIEDGAQFSGGTYNYDEFMEFVNRPPGAPGGPPMPANGAMNRGPSYGAPPPPGPPPPGPISAPSYSPGPSRMAGPPSGPPPPGPPPPGAPTSAPYQPGPPYGGPPSHNGMNSGMPPPAHVGRGAPPPPPGSAQNSASSHQPPHGMNPPPPNRYGPPSSGSPSGPPSGNPYAAGPPSGPPPNTNPYGTGPPSGPPSGPPPPNQYNAAPPPPSQMQHGYGAPPPPPPGQYSR